MNTTTTIAETNSSLDSANTTSTTTVSVVGQANVAGFSSSRGATGKPSKTGSDDSKESPTPKFGSYRKNSKTRQCTSLPIFYSVENRELCEIGSQPGMECMPLRTPTGPYHYHVTDQTKSLQELQNEVGALLEFRDLVIETFPDLKHKMASMSATNTLTGIAPSSSLTSRREWEPGIRVKRKIIQKENSEIVSSSLIRSRSNSHSGKKEPKSGEGNGSVVQDSGFSTETSSSKEAHSASSTTGAMQGIVASNRLPADADDELLNLLDVIHRKSNRLRDEVEYLQTIERDKFRKNISNNNSSDSCLHKTFQEHVDKLNREDLQLLRKERDRLLDKLAEMEAETLTGRIKASKMQNQFEELCKVKKELEEQLKLALTQKLELNSRLHELQRLYSSDKSSSSHSDSTSHRQSFSTTVTLPHFQGASSTPSTVTSQLITNRLANLSTSVTTNSTVATFTPVVVESSTSSRSDEKKTVYPFHSDNQSQTQSRDDLKNLGRLDGLISSPNRGIKVRSTDSKKIAAILLETNVLELQRHLLTLTVQNQILNQRLEQATKSKNFLLKKLDKSKEELDDIRFQLEEKDIELEGTKAQLRVLESKNPLKLDFNTETNRSSSTIILSSRDSPINSTQISTPSMKAMIPLPMEEIQHHSSSTESAQDQTERDSRLGSDTPKRRPSKIPLPGTKGYLAPKPPTGRCPSTQKSSPSGPVSNKSLSRSTGSLIKRSDIQISPNFQRPESAQSNSKDTSLGLNSRSSSSSIPISSKSTPSPQKISNSPLPKPKRDSLTSRVRHLDSLSRVYNSTTSSSTPSSPSSPPTHNVNNTSSSSNFNISANNNSTTNSNTITTSSTSNLHRCASNSKKDLSSSFTQGQLRDRKQSVVSVRRVSSASVGRGSTVDLQQQSETESGKIKKMRKIQSMSSLNGENIDEGPEEGNQGSNQLFTSRNLIREYISKTCIPPAMLRPSFVPYNSFGEAQIELAYTHPQLLLDFERKELDSKGQEDQDQHEKNLNSTCMKSLTNTTNTTTTSTSSPYQTNKGIEIKYFKNSLDYSNTDRKLFLRTVSATNFYVRNVHGNRIVPVAHTTIQKESPCRLIGKVNPSISRTWEQLNTFNSCNRSLTRSVSNLSDDSEKLFFCHPTVQESKSNFHVNKVIHSEEETSENSGNFYDSIDDDIHRDSNNNTNYENLQSMNQQAGAGEEMAEIDSFERKKCFWSVDSQFK